jgi:glycosyltransferase involved in cell wall biosynthesis
MTPVLSVVTPVYNEAATIQQVVNAVLAQPVVAELIVVDDGSTDGTRELLERLQASDPRLSVQRHETNRGKGASVRSGFAAAKSPIIVIQDADLEYDPSEYPKLLQPILDGRADVVFGSRFVGSEAHRVLYFWHSVGNRLLTLLSNIFTNLNLTDMESGFKAFTREVVERIELKEDRFGIEPELTAKFARLGVPIYEVAISYSGRTYGEGKKVSWRDGLSALRCIVQYNLLK